MLYRYFLFISMVLYGIGFSWLLYIGEYNLQDAKVGKHFYAYVYFVAGLILGGLLLLPFKPKKVIEHNVGAVSFEIIRNGHKLTNIVGLFACVFSIFYVVDGGYEKILLLGSNIDALDFRFLGLNDRPRIIAIPMELSRRILLPFAILAKMSLNRFTPNSNNRMLIFFILVFASVSIVNLDRGPILMFIVLIFYQLISVSQNLIFKLILGSSAIVIIGFTGAIFSFLQYNKTEFYYQDLVDTLEGILLNRIILSPVKMSQIWVFDRWSEFIDPLYMEYSRVSVLWGGRYVGSRESVSYLIAPAGVIGEIFRNLGEYAHFYVGVIFGSSFLFIERRLQTVPLLLRTPLNFVALILAMYLYYGNIFSLGPFAILVVLIIAPNFVSWVFKKSHKHAMAMRPRY